MMYLMTHLTHLIYSYMASDMVKDHSDSEKENLSPLLHKLFFLISNKVSFICTTPDRIAMAFVKHQLEQEIAK